MKNIRRLSLGLLGALFVMASAMVAMADPPGRVARIDYMTGGVSVQPGGVKDWVNAELNRPLTSADRVWTDKDSRAELHLGTAYMRMSSETSVTLTNLSDEAVQVELDQGTLNLRVRHLYAREIYEIDTPNLAFTITKSGEYRVDVDPNGDATLVTVRKGEGEATGENRAVRVRGGEQARFTGGTSLSHNLGEAPAPDGFDDWCRVRDRRQESYGSYRYVSPYVIGADDLDDYGTWHVAAGYGPLWVPAVAPGWAPYRYGHWIWVEPWGWTWVDDAPWGFAPCHYGRWVHYGGYWGWAPGPVIVRPVYAPALVAWFGGEHWGVGVSFGGPSVGWFPLGYGEPYVPPYYVSRNYFHNVNVNNTRITNVTNITNIYNTTYNTTNRTVRINNIDNSVNLNGNRNKVVVKYANRDVPGAVTAVPHDVMANGRPVQRAALRLSDNDVRSARIGMAAPVAPTKSGVLGAGGPSPLPPAHVQPRNVVSRMTPPPAPIPFSARQQALEARPGHPLDSGTERQLRANMGNPRGPVRENADRPAASMPSGRTPVAQPRVAESARPVSANPVRNVPRPPDRTMNGRANQPTDIADRTVPRVDSNTPARTVPRPPDRTYTGRQPYSGREVSQPRSADRVDVRQDSPRMPVRNVPRPPDSSDRGTVQQTDRPGRLSMPTPATADRPSNMDRPNTNRSVSRPESNSRPMMDSPRPNYPRAESRPTPQRDVYESRRVETRPADYPSARVQREPSAVRAAPPRQSAPAESHGGSQSQQSRGNSRESHNR